jgi:hypothetical protein
MIMHAPLVIDLVCTLQCFGLCYVDAYDYVSYLFFFSGMLVVCGVHGGSAKSKSVVSPTTAKEDMKLSKKHKRSTQKILG